MQETSPRESRLRPCSRSARRSRLMEKIGDGAAVVFGAQSRADDYDFRQGHDFFYLTGLELPDAVLIDWMLPNKSGLALARELRAFELLLGHASRAHF
mgnify:CR=1 FL=1